MNTIMYAEIIRIVSANIQLKKPFVSSFLGEATTRRQKGARYFAGGLVAAAKASVEAIATYAPRDKCLVDSLNVPSIDCVHRCTQHDAQMCVAELRLF